MITCRKLVRFLDDYIAGEMPEPILKRFESHIASCPMCRAYLESYRATIELERAALRCGQGGESAKPAEPMPEQLVKAILEASRTGGPERESPDGETKEGD
jgi:anti-sigma factor RsiW